VSNEVQQQNDDIPINQCEICRQLAEIETSFSKYGWDDMTQSLPAAAHRLKTVRPSANYDEERSHVEQCPICGIYYHYSKWYDYYVNGSEDEEKLVRLTPSEVRQYIDDERYEVLIGKSRSGLTDPDPLVRRYAGKCMASHHLHRRELEAAGQYAAHADPEVAQGALLFFRQLASERIILAELRELGEVFTAVSAAAVRDVADLAKGVLYWLGEVYSELRPS